LPVTTTLIAVVSKTAKPQSKNYHRKVNTKPTASKKIKINMKKLPNSELLSFIAGVFDTCTIKYFHEFLYKFELVAMV
jgi:hypothetical protein